MQSLQLETERLIMRPFEIKDAPLLFELNSDPDVTQYVGEGAYETVEQVEAFIRSYNQYEKYGLGRLNMFTKTTGEYIGWCGLKYLADRNEVDIGYRLLKQYWGKGYATESAKANLNYGFNTVGLERIIGMAMKENTASINVFKKLGLIYSHDESCGHQPGVIYAITKDQWK
jgi:ribosomal-protein-alanine N-acetyltransferase